MCVVSCSSSQDLIRPICILYYLCLRSTVTKSRHWWNRFFYSLQSIPTVVYLLVCFQLPCSPPSFALTDRPEHQTNPVDCIFPRDSLNERSFSSLPRYYITLDLYIRISAPGTVRSYSGDIHRMYILTSLRFLCTWETLNTNTLSVLSKRYLIISKHLPTQPEISYRKVSKNTSHEQKTQVASRKRISLWFRYLCIQLRSHASTRV